MTTTATHNAHDTTPERGLFVAFELRGYPKSKDYANMLQSWILLPFPGDLPCGCHTSQTVSDGPDR